MSNIITILFSLILGISNPTEAPATNRQQETVSTYYLIRHAEKDRTNSGNRNPDLKKEGHERAKKWAAVLKEIDFDAIYSTDYKRTLQTANPIADLNKLEIFKYDASKLFDREFENATKGKTVLVVGHSNTTPQFVNAIIREKKYEDLDDSENGALFIVQVLADGSTISQVLYIN